MLRHPVHIIILIAVFLSVAFIAGCGSDVKTPKYPGQTEPVGEGKVEGQGIEPSAPPESGAEGSGSGIGAMTPDSKPGGDTTNSATSPVTPYGAEPVARPLQAGEEEEELEEGEEEASEETEEEPAKEEPVEEEPAVEEPVAAQPAEEEYPERKKTPSYNSQLGTDGFDYNAEGSGPVGSLNEMLKAIDILTVNEEKYEHAEGYLTAEAEGLSRGDPLFIPEAVPDELRPLIAGEGISGALDQELIELFISRMQADLRSIPIWITGVMEQGGSKVAIGSIWGSMKFQVRQGQEFRMWYSGWYVLGVTGSLISEDLVVLNLRLLQYSGRGFSPVTDYVPRSFHIGIT